MRLEDYDYHLPPELIAQHPESRRDGSRLLVLDRAGDRVVSDRFENVARWLRDGDLLVTNDTRVLRARLRSRRVGTGGEGELLMIEPRGEGIWEAMARPARRLREGVRLEVGDRVVPVRGRCEGGGVLVDFGDDEAAMDCMRRFGELPLPPYVKESLDDGERYQTVFARKEGAVAAPTAGLHFTDEILRRLEARGIRRVAVTLHVGPGTFRPVSAEQIETGRLHSERYEVSAETARAVAEARREGRRVVAVGTTSMRVLETMGRETNWPVEGCAGRTEIFIHPGVPIRVVSALFTNFHLPRTSLLMLVHAFAGADLARRAYARAIAERYRFYSFGDASFIF